MRLVEIKINADDEMVTSNKPYCRAFLPPDKLIVKVFTVNFLTVLMVIVSKAKVS